MKNYLAIDTSGAYLSVVACKNGEYARVFDEDGALQHSVRLMDAVQEALDALHLSPSECDFFCAVIGPGSFTGIRIGISAIKGFCAATDKAVLGRTSFQVLAYNAESKALAAVSAGRGNYYVCGFGENKEIILAPTTVNEEKLRELSEEFTVYSYSELPVESVKPDMTQGLIRAVERATEEEFGDLGAFYMKKSQAEEQRAARLEKQQ